MRSEISFYTTTFHKIELTLMSQTLTKFMKHIHIKASLIFPFHTENMFETQFDSTQNLYF